MDLVIFYLSETTEDNVSDFVKSVTLYVRKYKYRSNIIFRRVFYM
jgi:hypothetical protein